MRISSAPAAPMPGGGIGAGNSCRPRRPRALLSGELSRSSACSCESTTFGASSLLPILKGFDIFAIKPRRSKRENNQRTTAVFVYFKRSQNLLDKLESLSQEQRRILQNSARVTPRARAPNRLNNVINWRLRRQQVTGRTGSEMDLKTSLGSWPSNPLQELHSKMTQGGRGSRRPWRWPGPEASKPPHSRIT